jgi:hypothetical protein
MLSVIELALKQLQLNWMLRADGKPHREREAEIIRELTGVKTE